MKLCVCAVLMPALVAAQSAMLQIRLESEGMVFSPGSRSGGLVLFVGDELGRPVPDAVATLKLPLDGAGGAFANGLTTEVVKTGADGRSVTSGVRWGRTDGPVEIRITAVKGNLRAGTVASVQVGGDGALPATAARRSPAVERPKSRKWLILGVIAIGAAGAGFAGGRAASGKSGSSGSGGGTTPGDSVQIGTPSISIGKP